MTTESDPATRPSMAVVEAVASEAGVDPGDLECVLAETVDPGALDALFASGRGDGTVAFDYCGYAVTVGADGTVEVE